MGHTTDEFQDFDAVLADIDAALSPSGTTETP